MLDIKFIRENPDIIKAGAKKKCINIEYDKLVAADDKRLALLREVEGMREKQNQVSKEVASTPDQALRGQRIEEMKVLKETLQKKEDELRETMKEWHAQMLMIPNIPDISVPEGDNDEKNVELRTWGEIPKFTFTPKNQMELMKMHDMVDFERGVKVAGFRGYFLKNAAVKLSLALWQFTLDEIIKKGFTPMMAPIMDRKESFIGTGFLPQSEEDLYRTQDGEYLAGTAEVPVMGYYMNETLNREQLPVKMVAFSPCYRREVGAHGKDTQGLIRVHEFFKIEQLVLCEANHEVSVRFHEEITANAEALVQALKIPYHVVVNCGGDLGLGQVKKYDIECWVPSEGRYRETHSASYFHDFQTRRLGIKYRDENGKLKFAHSLNNTALATPRILVPLIENYQQADGSIKVPEVLQKYAGFDTIK